LQANPPISLKAEKLAPLPVHTKAAHFVTKKATQAKPAIAETGPSTHIPLPRPSLAAQLEPISGAADSGTIGQSTVGLVPIARSRTIQEQVAAATAMVERTTASVAERDDAEPVDGSSVGKANAMVAIVMARPEISSVTDLAGKDVAIDQSHSASSIDVRIAFALAGARSVELSAGERTAIDRLVNREVPAAVLAVVSADSADGFPEIGGFKIFHVPLLPRHSKTRP
jgi:hypothetical protein